jgi:hypothetical protein
MDCMIIAAGSEEEKFIKLILGGIFLFIVVIGSILNAFRKQQERKSRGSRLVWDEVLHQVREEGPANVKPTMKRRPTAARKTQGRKQVQQAQRRKVVTPPPLPAGELAAAGSSGKSLGTAQPPAPAARVTNSVRTMAIAKALSTRNLQQQFIITEALQPPVSIR